MDVSGAFEQQDNFLKTNSVDSILIMDGVKKQPWITIAIPTYKRSEVLKETLRSALNQRSSVEYEVLVVDNNSERFCETERMITTDFVNTGKLRYYKNVQNIGLFGNWNRCFQLACGKWVVLLHDDDLIFDAYLLKTVYYLNRIPDCTILKPQMDNWLDDGNSYHRSTSSVSRFLSKYSFYCALDYVFLGNFVGSPTGCFFLKDYILQKGGFSLSIYPSADTGFLLSAAIDKKVVLLHEVLGVRRIGQNESLKPETEARFLEARYSFILYLIRFYNIEWLIGKRYMAYCIQEYRKNLSVSSADIMRKELPRINGMEQFYYRILIILYKLFRMLRTFFNL